LYNFHLFGNILSFNSKLMKHMGNRNCERLKDYICAAYNTFDPANHAAHPCYSVLKDAIKLIKGHGWRVAVCDYKDQGKQIVVISPNGDYYHSNFKR